MAYISEHISWTEAIRSNTAKKHEIENIPNQSQIVNMKSIAKNIFEPLRTWANEPIRINSFFRSPELCIKIKSKPTSQHTKGQALDIDAMGEKTNGELFEYIKENLNFDQLIWEHGDNENPDWIHVSYVDNVNNRNRILKAVKKGKKTTYEYYV
tara:strand:- start:18018 stop:18479 length:462 start_codon:yes stop_codon:yes gene_type:complete